MTPTRRAARTDGWGRARTEAARVPRRDVAAPRGHRAGSTGHNFSHRKRNDFYASRRCGNVLSRGATTLRGHDGSVGGTTQNVEPERAPGSVRFPHGVNRRDGRVGTPLSSLPALPHLNVRAGRRNPPIAQKRKHPPDTPAGPETRARTAPVRSGVAESPASPGGGGITAVAIGRVAL